MIDIPDKYVSELIIRSLTGGATPSEGETLVRGRDAWQFRTIGETLPEFHPETLDALDNYTPDFSTYRCYEITVIGTPIQISNPLNIEEGQSYFFRFLVNVDALEIRWGTDDLTTVFYFPGGVGTLSQVTGKIDHVTFVARDSSTLDGVIVPDLSRPAGLQ